MDNVNVTLQISVSIPSEDLMDNLSRKHIASYLNSKFYYNSGWFGHLTESNIKSITTAPKSTGLSLSDILSKEHTLE
jgi:hypothetical protein